MNFLVLHITFPPKVVFKAEPVPRLLRNRLACYRSPKSKQIWCLFRWGPNAQFSIKETIGLWLSDLQVKNERDS